MPAERQISAKGAIQAKVAASTKNENDTQYSPTKKYPTPNHQLTAKADREMLFVSLVSCNRPDGELPSINQASPTKPGISNGNIYRGGNANAVTTPNKSAKTLLGHLSSDTTHPRSCSILEIK